MDAAFANRRRRLRSWFMAALALAAGSVGAQPAGGGTAPANAPALALEMAPNGTVAAVRLFGQRLDLAAAGGFSCSEVTCDPAVGPASLYENRFGEGAPAWRPRGSGTANAAAVALVEDGNSFVRIGDTAQFGHGLEPQAPLAVQPGTLCELAWQGRVPDGASTFIVYMRLFDRDGKDITASAPPPSAWTFSPFSNTHYRHLIAPSKPMSWERLALRYRVPEGASAILPSICLWRGACADVDDLTLTQVSRTGEQEIRFDRQAVTVTPDGTELQLASSDQALALEARVRQDAGTVRIEARLRDTSEPPRPRALRLRFSLPLALNGWQWHRHWRADAPITPDAAFMNTHPMSGHAVSFYPFTAVSRGDAGLALGVPPGAIALEHRRVRATGIVSETALGLQPRPGPAAAAGTALSFVLFPFRGHWGFRSAAAAYYRLYAEDFRPRTPREGLWMFAMTPSQLPPHPEDFGFAFWEGWSNSPAEQDLAHQLGIRIHPYTEAWGLRQPFPEAHGRNEMPPLPERLTQLRAWAASTEPGKTWNGMPRQEAAQAVLNSLPVAPDGSHPFSVDHYDVWYHWWRTNPDPNLPRPNRATLCWDYDIAPRLQRADGVYLDSLSYDFAANYLNLDPAHLAVVEDPLTFDPETARPAADGIQHQVAFVRWLRNRLLPEGKLLQGNLFGISHRFHATLVDVLGSEVGSFGGKRHMDIVEEDDVCGMERFYAYHRPVCNLLQEGNYEKPVPELTQAEMQRYIDHQLFYAFYPGVSTIGGEEKPGYAGWKRYFRGGAQCERDRALFQEAVPLIRRLNQAGWQPETGARCDLAAILVERYGQGPAGEVLFTLRNPSAEPARTTLRLEPSTLGLPPDGPAPKLVALRRGGGAPTTGTETGAFGLVLGPWETSVLRLE